MILNVWPLNGGQSSSYLLYEDGSDSESYKHGVYALTPVSAAQTDDMLTIDIAPVQGSYPSMQPIRGCELCLLDDLPPDAVTANGEAIAFQSTGTASRGWHYDGNTLSTIIHIPSHPISEAVHIEVRRSASTQVVRVQQLDGFAGATVRLHAAYDTLNQEWPFTWSPDSLIDAWQTGDRLSYHPDTARNELSQFAQKYAAAETSVQQLYDSVSGLSGDQLLEELKAHHPDTTKERSRHYRESIQRALAQLKDGKP
jgi:hypothetical protein